MSDQRASSHHWPGKSFLAACMYALVASATAFVANAAPEALAPSSVLQVAGDRVQAITLDSTALRAMPRRELRFTGHRGSGAYAGVPLSAVLDAAGLSLADGLHNGLLACHLMVTARDGYQVVFSLAELAPAFGNLTAVLADHKNGKPLPDFEGPYRLLVPDAPRPARSPRQVMRLTVNCPDKAPAPNHVHAKEPTS